MRSRVSHAAGVEVRKQPLQAGRWRDAYQEIDSADAEGLRHAVAWDAADKIAGVVTDNLSVLSGSGARFEQPLNGG